jgi:hypothetical protein
MSRNTKQLAQLAKATESSGQEIHEMTRRMELDAKNMRFLAEITAFFLPLTAIAVSFSNILVRTNADCILQTFFSMGFLDISSGPSLIPQMDNLKYIWLYCISLAITSAAAFSWWYYKHRSSIVESSKDQEIELEPIETKMEMQAQRDKSLRRKYAMKKCLENLAELKECDAARARGEHPPNDMRLTMKLLAGKQAMETGEDYDELVALMTSKI